MFKYFQENRGKVLTRGEGAERFIKETFLSDTRKKKDGPSSKTNAHFRKKRSSAFNCSEKNQIDQDHRKKKDSGGESSSPKIEERRLLNGSF